MDPTTRRVDIGSLAFRVLSSPGDSQSTLPPVALVHGIGMSHRYLSRLHAVLATGGRVFSIDLPGFAGLPKPGQDVDVIEMGRALAEVVASLDVEPIVLVGHSMGAQWVVEAALHQPDLVRLVAVIGPVADVEHRTLTAHMRALAIDTFGESPVANAVVFTDYIRCGAPWYLAQLRHMLAYPLEVRVASLSMPLLVMRGGHDPIAGLAWCRLLRDRAIDGRLVQIPRQPHIAQHGGAKAVASALLAAATDFQQEAEMYGPVS